MTESVILCEGFYDRAFWAGMLAHLGLTDPGLKPGFKQRSPVKDIRNEIVTQGQFYYYTPMGNGVRVVPCHSKDNIPGRVRIFLSKRETEPLARLIVNVDADTNADGTPASSQTLGFQSIITLLRKIDSDLIEAADRTVLLDDGATIVSLIQWQANDAASSHLPNQQTLERLVCASLCSVYPERGTVVKNWLQSHSGDAPEAGVKEFALSHMAGWYADQGCDAFYRCLWEDAAVAAEMKIRLQASGAWAIAEAIAQ